MDIASGSVDSALAGTVLQPLREAVATSGVSARSDAATTPRRLGAWLGDLEAWQVGGPTRMEAAAPGP